MTYKLINEILNGDESLKEEMSAEDEDAYDNHPAYISNAQRGLWQ